MLTIAKAYNANLQQLLQAAQELELDLAEYQGLAYVNLRDLVIEALKERQVEKPVLRQAYYCLHVHWGKEQHLISQLKERVATNTFDSATAIEKGVINKYFKLSDVILDIAYPIDYDFVNNRLAENYKSYLFVKLSALYRQDILDDVLVPFFKSLHGVIGLVGIKHDIKTANHEPLRRNQVYSKNGRTVVHPHNIGYVKPSQVRQREETALRDYQNFSVYEQPALAVGSLCWLTTQTQHKIHRQKVTIVKAFTDGAYQVKATGRGASTAIVQAERLQLLKNNLE